MRRTSTSSEPEPYRSRGVRALQGIDHVGISIAHRDGKIETRAGTHQLVWDLDALQDELDEGPCVHAILVRVSQHSNIKLRDVVQELIDRANERVCVAD